LFLGLSHSIIIRQKFVLGSFVNIGISRNLVSLRDDIERFVSVLLLAQ